MKKITLLAIATIFLLNFSFAENNPTIANNNKVFNVITKLLQYPSSAKDNLIEGYVLLGFSVDENGIVQIDQIYSNKAELKEYVQKELNKLVIEDLVYIPDQIYEMKVVFKLE
jgi:hypothetical protein